MPILAPGTRTPAPLASTKTRTNDCLNPVAQSATTGWSTAAGTSGAATSVAGAAVTGCPDATTGYQATWTTAPTAGTCGGYYYASTTHSGSDGGKWRGAAWARFSWACNAYSALYAYDSTGAVLATHVMPTVAVTANTWTRFASDDWQPPAGTDRLLFLVYRTTGGLPAVGDTFQMTACVIESAVKVPTLDPYGAPPFFDGDSLNAMWLGTVHNSASTLMVVSQNAALPVLEVEAWPGVSPTITGVPTTQGTRLTDRAKAFKIARGRQYELDQDQAATGNLTLNNNDGQVTGGTNGCTPITSARVRARWNGTTYPVWTGLIRSWPQQDDTPAAAWSDAELTDTFEPLANHPFGPLIYETIHSQAAPDLWYPMNESASSTSIGGVIPGNPLGVRVAYKGGAGATPLLPGATSVFAGTSETVMAQGNATDAASLAMNQYQIAGPQNPSGYSLPMTSPWSVGMLVRCTAGSTTIFQALDAAGKILAGVIMDYSSAAFQFYYRDASGTAQDVAFYTTRTAMASGGYLHFGHDGTNAFMWLYGINPDGSIYSSSHVTPVSQCTQASQWVAWGGLFTSSSSLTASNQCDYQMCHATIWTTSPPVPNGAAIQAIATAGLNAAYSNPSKTVVSTLASFAGIPTVVGDPTDGQPLGQIRDLNKTSVLDAIRQVTLDYLGRIFMSKDGSLTWQSVHHAMGKPVQWALGGHPGEQPYTGAPHFNYDPTYVYNDVTVQRPDNHGVDQQAQSTKAIMRVTDTASQAAYFQRVLQIDSNVRADADALAIAQYLLARYKQPAMRVQTVRFEPHANPALWPFILGSELGDTITLNHRALNRPAISLTLAIQQISHDVDATAGTWVTSMELAPWSSDWALAAMHTTVSAATAAGSQYVYLSPLPDSATNPAEASLGLGTTMTLSKGTANEETLTISAVYSQPTNHATNYTQIQVWFTANTAHPHAVGEVCCDPLPTGVTDPTTWDPFSVLDSTTVVSI